VSKEIAGSSAAFAERMRELRTGSTDPRLAPMLAQLQALMRQHVAGATPAVIPLAEEYVVDLPVELADLLSCYLDTCPARAFAHAATLSESDAGRRILDLSPADRVRIGRRGLSRLGRSAVGRFERRRIAARRVRPFARQAAAH
jgi:hypothetical protein